MKASRGPLARTAAAGSIPALAIYLREASAHGIEVWRFV
jgi:hypothetical protein